jgi:D-alanyl-D-alanine carboxypeptidase/D-alanyl-D-alanine-endopeptidase (penicillin-binding protein 4)
MKPFMKNSIDMMGDALFKFMGARFGSSSAETLLDAGQQVLREFNAGISSELTHAVIYDGSGVSREDQVTPGGLLHLLNWLKNRDDFDVLWQSLPIAGVDGTLIYRMKGTVAEGVLRAKTGTLNGVYNLSGYVPVTASDGGQEYVPFVVLTRGSSYYESAAHASEDRVGVQLASLLQSENRFIEPADRSISVPYIPEHSGLDRATH